MKKADPLSLIILFIVSALALAGALYVRNSILRDQEAQQGSFTMPQDMLAPMQYNGAKTLDDLAADICNPGDWFPALMPDFLLFTHTAAGGDPNDFDRSPHLDPRWLTGANILPQMQYCRVHSTYLMDCGQAFTYAQGRLMDDDMTVDSMNEAGHMLGVQGCGIARMSMTLSVDNKDKIFHHVIAGLVQDRWRVLLFLP